MHPYSKGLLAQRTWLPCKESLRKTQELTTTFSIQQLLNKSINVLSSVRTTVSRQLLICWGRVLVFVMSWQGLQDCPDRNKKSITQLPYRVTLQKCSVSLMTNPTITLDNPNPILHFRARDKALSHWRSENCTSCTEESPKLQELFTLLQRLTSQG